MQSAIAKSKSSQPRNVFPLDQKNGEMVDGIPRVSSANNDEAEIANIILKPLESRCFFATFSEDKKHHPREQPNARRLEERLRKKLISLVSPHLVPEGCFYRP